jgi:4-hydroxy-tetrahydrodipicolinate synthase
MSFPSSPFGNMVTAMVTPFKADGSVDLAGAEKLANCLVDLGNDGLVVNGTTGESATTTEEEKNNLLAAVIGAVGDRAQVIAGVGSNDTAHTMMLAKDAERIGADSILVVTPYYNKPTQAGLIAHFTSVADLCGLPMMMYDIPGRSVVPIEVDTMLKLAEHPRIVANKDAKNNFEAASRVITNSDLQWFSGEDILNLPLLTIGAVGCVSVVGHVAADRIKKMMSLYFDGDVAGATKMHKDLTEVYYGVMGSMPGVMSVKAYLKLKGLPGGDPRLPLVAADKDQTEKLVTSLRAGGVQI